MARRTHGMLTECRSHAPLSNVSYVASQRSMKDECGADTITAFCSQLAPWPDGSTHAKTLGLVLGRFRVRGHLHAERRGVVHEVVKRLDPAHQRRGTFALTR